MKKAMLKSDPSRRLIPMARWLIENRDDTASCPVCGHDLRVDAQLSKKVVTHFTHPQGVKCPTSAVNGTAYVGFKKIARGSAADALRVRRYALDNLESIYYRAMELCPELRWTEFLPLLDRATELDAWSFKDFDVLYIPYLLLCCADSFSGIKGSKRPSAIFFVLEPGASESEFWHRPQGEKQRIWRVFATTKHVDDIAMKLQEIEPWYRSKARMAMKL
ncbi:hypothetical protein [Xanthomonas hortorum]|uniref:Uncharacterized protein n=1 Tax=Xanthomonas hortorum pv. hederae TaxID=453603 RepID=A0A9X4BWH1_9XANT|nr:hypothetical protein [Xanthomonas hortorum]MCE4373906.1 hypothetical protein [Xanthomonas hortorum pv. hederae]MDC8640867.1 hypothetical protein [Xanthomonas hortorum pv. hederae]PPU70461.1 hypothetical protein XhhCFBP4925_23365 [Xanthomonas hortorum pv. hederae]PUE91092.1 hypothetical protein C7T87_24285 [Xanthomonas hortorum pv. hederae]